MSFFESLVFLAFLIYFRIPVTPNILFLPIIIAIFFFITLGTSLVLAAMNVFFRDIQYIWALALQIGFFASPVIFPLTIFQQPLLQVLSYNPIAQILFLARDVTLYSRLPNLASLSYAITIAVMLLIIGYFIFFRLEPKFAEEL
jgi:lipopolysaccharide transport system permease protein